MAEKDNNQELQNLPKGEQLLPMEEIKQTPDAIKAITGERRDLTEVLSSAKEVLSESYFELQKTIASYVQKLKKVGYNIKDQLNVLEEIPNALWRLSPHASLSLMLAIAPFLSKAGIKAEEGRKDGVIITTAPTVEKTENERIREEIEAGYYENVGDLDANEITINDAYFSTTDAEKIAAFKGNKVTIEGNSIRSDAIKQLTQNINSKLFHSAQEIGKINLAEKIKEIQDQLDKKQIKVQNQLDKKQINEEEAKTMKQINEKEAEDMIKTFKTQINNSVKDAMKYGNLGGSYTFNTDITSTESTFYLKDLKVGTLNVTLNTYASESFGASKNDPNLASKVAENIMQCPAPHMNIWLKKPVSDAAYREYFVNNNKKNFHIYAPNLSTEASSYVKFCNTENLSIRGITLDAEKATNIASQLMERDTSGIPVPQLDEKGNPQYRKSLNLYFEHYEPGTKDKPGAIEALMKFPNKLTITVTKTLTADDTKKILSELQNHPVDFTLNLKQLYMNSLKEITLTPGMTINVTETIDMKAKEQLEKMGVKVGGNTKNLYIDADTIYQYASEDAKKAMDEYNTETAIKHKKDKQGPDLTLGSK